jgi:hypothetical protein
MHQTIFMSLFQLTIELRDFNNLTIPSASDWLDKNPLLKWGAIASIAALALLVAQAFNNQGRI